MSESPISQPPVSFDKPRIGTREASLFMIAAGFAALMVDQPRLAVLTGWVVVALWLYGLVRGPRLSWTLTIVLGAGLFVTTMWWTRQDWWHAAIALLWIGLGMIALGFAGLIAGRISGRQEHALQERPAPPR